MPSVLRAIGLIWSLPVSILGLIIAGFLGPIEGEIRDGCLWIRVHRLPGSYVATTQGHVISYVSLPGNTAKHELRHVAQCDLFGPIIFILYPLASLISKLRGTGWYRGNALEVDARQAAAQ